MARAPRSYYGRFTGGPDRLAPPVDLAEALDAVSESVMDGYSADSALREFLRRRTRPGRPGPAGGTHPPQAPRPAQPKIGRASCRERGGRGLGDGVGDSTVVAT